MNNVFVFFVEPASYTIDLINNVHIPKKIGYAFIKSSSYYKEQQSDSDSLEKMSFSQKINFIVNVFKKNSLIIVNGYNNYVFIFTWMLNLFSKKKKYIGVESDTQLKSDVPLLKSLIKTLFLKTIFKSKYVIGLAGGTKTHFDLFLRYGMKRRNIFLLPMVVNNSFYYRKKKYMINKKFSFLIVSRLIKTKNIEPVIKFFDNHFENKDAILKIVGDGPLLKRFLEKYQNENIRFYGKLYRDNLIKEYHNSNVFLMPSYQESWGLVINEAMCSGLPVISRKEVGANYDLITNNENGFIANSNEDFFNKMVILYKNHELCETMSKKSIDIMKSTWNYNLYADCLDKIYLFSKDK